jgi:hypothetical protein
MFSCSAVYEELVNGNDELADWAKARKDNGFFRRPTQEAQEAFQKIADFVSSEYPPHSFGQFLAGADPWLVAQALVDGATVVTHEVLVPPAATVIKIPNICKQFGVPYTTIYNVMKTLKVRFSLSA